MAKHIQLIDDIDGTKAAETVEFGLDGRKYAIDLSTKNAKRLRDALHDFLSVAEDITDLKQAKPTNTEITMIREWAKTAGLPLLTQKGLTVNDRGRVPQEIIDLYHSNI